MNMCHASGKRKKFKKSGLFFGRKRISRTCLGNSGGLDGARWFQLSEFPELRIYNDIIPLITKAIEIISKK